MSDDSHSVDARPTSLALPFTVGILFLYFATQAATCDISAGRTQTLETPTQEPLSVHYEGCRGTPTQMTQCYMSHVEGK